MNMFKFIESCMSALYTKTKFFRFTDFVFDFDFDIRYLAYRHCRKELMVEIKSKV